MRLDAADSTVRDSRMRHTGRRRARCVSPPGAVLAGAVALAVTCLTTALPAAPRPRTRRGSAVGMRIVVSLARRHLWVLDRDDTLLSAPAAVASGRSLEFAGRHWTFHAPAGPRTVIAKEKDPVWRPPDWLYAETARDYGLALARLRPGHPVRLPDGELLGVHDAVVGLTDPASGRFAALPVHEHIVFDDTLYIPPFATRNRHVTGELGRYALDLGNGYLIHGTPEHDSIGQAVTHGCIRLDDADVRWLYRHVPVGTPVYIH